MSKRHSEKKDSAAKLDSFAKFATVDLSKVTDPFHVDACVGPDGRAFKVEAHKHRERAKELLQAMGIQSKGFKESEILSQKGYRKIRAGILIADTDHPDISKEQRKAATTYAEGPGRKLEERARKANGDFLGGRRQDQGFLAEVMTPPDAQARVRDFRREQMKAQGHHPGD